MSYPMELDEYPDNQLQHELDRRAKLRRLGCCGYCGRTSDAHHAAPCRFWANRERAAVAAAKGTT